MTPNFLDMTYSKNYPWGWVCSSVVKPRLRMQEALGSPKAKTKTKEKTPMKQKLNTKGDHILVQSQYCKYYLQ
jgi:hypothetical protein